LKSKKKEISAISNNSIQLKERREKRKEEKREEEKIKTSKENKRIGK